jgi:hypothetical protein
MDDDDLDAEAIGAAAWADPLSGQRIDLAAWFASRGEVIDFGDDKTLSGITASQLLIRVNAQLSMEPLTPLPEFNEPRTRPRPDIWKVEGGGE